MLDERTMRAGERAAAARRRAFTEPAPTATRSQPLGVVPVIVLCLVGVVLNGYAVVAFDLGLAFDVASAGLAVAALLAAFGLASEQRWAWTITWMYLALHVFLDLVTASILGPVAFAVAIVYALALLYASARRASEVADETNLTQ
jgi:hypothetical protein